MSSVAADHVTSTPPGAAVATTLAGALGALPAPGTVMVTVAPPAVIAAVVIVTPLTGSVTDWPTASAASLKAVEPAVPGVASISAGCVRLYTDGPSRSMTPLTGPDPGRKLSKYVPYGCRTSMYRAPPVRGIRSSWVAAVSSSEAAIVYVPLEVTVYVEVGWSHPSS